MTELQQAWFCKHGPVEARLAGEPVLLIPNRDPAKYGEGDSLPYLVRASAATPWEERSAVETYLPRSPRGAFSHSRSEKT